MLSQTLRYALILVAPLLVLAVAIERGMDDFLADPDRPRRSAAVQLVAPGEPADRGHRRAVGRSYEFRAGANGHFMVEAMVNGETVAFVIDTGASDVALSPADARRLGFEPERLEFDRRYQTASGVALGASVTLREVSIGQLSIRDVEASVIDAPLQVSLLGMSFLKRLEGYEVRDNRLILHW